MFASLLAALLLNDAHAGALVSSFKKETKLGANYWSGAAAVDGKPDTCWMISGETENEGQFITIDLPKSEVDKVGMVIGWAKDDDTFKDYARVKSVRVEVLSYNEDRELVSAGAADVSFEDKAGMQIVDMPNFKLGTDEAGGKVKITVTSVYPGRDFPNFAVSEVMVVLAEYDAQISVASTSGEDAGHGKDLLMDANAKTFWSAPAEGATIELATAGFGVARMAITNGPKDYARVKKLKLSVGNRKVDIDIPDAAGPQWFEVPALNGYTGSAWGEITLEIAETYPGTKSQSVAISEISAKATSFEGL